MVRYIYFIEWIERTKERACRPFEYILLMGNMIPTDIRR